MPTRKERVEQRVEALAADFTRYVDAYDQLVPFTGEQLASHRETIALRLEAGSLKAALKSERFVASLRRTLLAWGIGGRASYLVPGAEFGAALLAALPALEQLEPVAIDAPNLPEDIADGIGRIIESLGVVDNKAKLVAGTKTLHHLLPDLVVPIDRMWTGTFFELHGPEWQDPSTQRSVLRRTFTTFVEIARRVDPQQSVTGEGWRTSRTKILDNALIAFCKLEIMERSSADAEAPNGVSFEVRGYPPAKNEALSMLGTGHAHGPRVRLLLEAARRALHEQAFVPIEEGPVALDVVVHAPAGQDPWGATNYLGGIGEVLEDKSRRGALEHLGDLVSVWLYRNDRQIREVSYKQVEAAEASYVVNIRRLAGDR